MPDIIMLAAYGQDGRRRLWLNWLNWRWVSFNYLSDTASSFQLIFSRLLFGFMYTAYWDHRVRPSLVAIATQTQQLSPFSFMNETNYNVHLVVIRFPLRRCWGNVIIVRRYPTSFPASADGGQEINLKLLATTTDELVIVFQPKNNMQKTQIWVTCIHSFTLLLLNTPRSCWSNRSCK